MAIPFERAVWPVCHLGCDHTSPNRRAKRASCQVVAGRSRAEPFRQQAEGGFVRFGQLAHCVGRQELCKLFECLGQGLERETESLFGPAEQDDGFVVDGVFGQLGAEPRFAGPRFTTNEEDLTLSAQGYVERLFTRRAFCSSSHETIGRLDQPTQRGMQGPWLWQHLGRPTKPDPRTGSRRSRIGRWPGDIHRLVSIRHGLRED